MSILSKPYKTIDEAALGGFKKIVTKYPEYKDYEYGFIIVSFDRPIVRQIGHEGFMDTEAEYRYTEPFTDRLRREINWKIPPHFAARVRALCHTHPVPGTFSTRDFKGFQEMRELKRKGDLKYDIIYYLLQSDGRVRRSSGEHNFWEGDIIEGLSKATP